MSRRSRITLLAIVLASFALSCSEAPTGPNDTAWRYLPGRVESLVYGPFRDGRQCWVYLPPDYANSGRRYPVLYFNDGEAVFDVAAGIHLNRICEEMIRGGQIEPIIVVAIENGPGHQRFVDYTPWTSWEWAPNGGGDAYLRAVVDTLKPEVDRRFRTLTDPEHTAMAGTSLGGLISVYAAYAHGGTFGKVGAFSPAYPYAGYEMLRLAQATGRPPHLVRFYQDTGWPYDNFIDGMESIALGQGFVSGVDLVSVVARGAEHTNAAWAHRAPAMLRFLFPR